jgi:hypothetical protein
MMANADNPRTGAEFERLVQAFFAGQGLSLVPKLGVPVGIGTAKKVHRFDLGSETPPVLVECKCHVWTEGGNAPSAKLTVWNEAMLYFACAPEKYRKIMVVQRSLRGLESLAEHYLKRYRHLVPTRVEIWEFDPATTQGRLLHESRGE